MKVETLPVIQGENNLTNYEEAYANFNGKRLIKIFLGMKQGQVNMAYEAIDRHAEIRSKE